MFDVAAYAVVKLQVTDNATYRQYERGFFPLLTRHDGEFVTHNDAAFTLEGASPRLHEAGVLESVVRGLPPR